MSTADGVRDRRSKAAPVPTLQGVERALRVLDVLATRPMRTSDLADEFGISWATLQRTLAQLESAEYIERDELGLFRIGKKAWLVGSTYLVGHRLLELAIPVLSQASTEIPQAVLQLVERSGGTSVVLHSHETSSSESITKTTYGYHFPLHCGSKGLVLLAYEDESFVEDYLGQPLISLTSQTITDPGELRDRLAEVRASGYSVTRADVQSFTGSVSAPIYDAKGVVRSCVSAVTRRSALTGEKLDGILEVVLRIAQSLSLGMGWQPLWHARAPQAQSGADGSGPQRGNEFGSSKENDGSPTRRRGTDGVEQSSIS